MIPAPYTTLSDQQLLELCVWREARGEGMIGKRAVAHSIINRAARPCWWGHDIQSVILKPWQYSSFNHADPNSQKWPADDDPSYLDCVDACAKAMNGDVDPASGATSYHDISIPAPTWTQGMFMTLFVGRLKFYR